MRLSRNTFIDPELEKKVLITLITSDRALLNLEGLTSPEIFQLGISKVIVKWILDYFIIYKLAPKKNIQDIFFQEKDTIPSNIQEDVQDFLEELSTKFIEEEENPTNPDYVVKRAEDYLKQRRLIYDAEQIIKLSQAGDLVEAERVRYKERIILSKIPWHKPFDDRLFINEVFRDDTETLLELGGGLEKLMGPLKRGYFLGLMAFTKRGKTWYMQEICDWLLATGKRVAWVSLEMDSYQFSERLYMKMSATSNERGGKFQYPILDCLQNQQGTCIKLGWFSGKPCTKCKEEDSESFIPTVIQTLIERPKMDRRGVLKTTKLFGNMFGKNLFRLTSFPSNAANVRDVLGALDSLEYTENFIPDAIFIDYADLLRSEDPRIIGREAIDLTWRSLKGMASEKKALVVTVSQSNRGSSEKSLLKESDTAEDIRKLAHVDVMLSLNQTEAEKEQGIMRIGVLEHRWKKFSRNRLLMVLQQLEVGQTNLDSVIINWNDVKAVKNVLNEGNDFYENQGKPTKRRKSKN